MSEAGRLARQEAREWLWSRSSLDRLQGCGRYVVGDGVAIVRRGDRARWVGLQTCRSVWSCPVCSAKIWAQRAAELGQALDEAHARGLTTAMVTLTMRHGPGDTLVKCWDAVSDAWAAAAGRSTGARRAREAAGVVGWARRVEVTWGRHGWHVHVHALVICAAGADVAELGDAMFHAWAARLARLGLTPIRDSGGLDARALSLDEAREDVAGYVAKGTYDEQVLQAALELAGNAKLGRRGNLTPWALLHAARAGNRQAAALWHEWEQTSAGRRALTWSQDLRAELGLGDELDDEDLADELAEGASTEADELVGTWHRSEWPAIRDTPGAVVGLLDVAERARPALAGAAVLAYCVERGLPTPRPADSG